MKVIHVVPSVGPESAGPSYSVPALCGGLVRSGCDVSLFLKEPLPNRDLPCRAYSFKSAAFPHPRLGRSPWMLKGLREECKTADIIHNNGLWLMPNVYPDWARKGTKCKLVNQPRGTLSKWALSNSKWRKRLFGWLFQNEVLRHTDMWIATAESEYEEIRNLGYRQPVAIIPNGIDIPSVIPIPSKKHNERRRMFFLSRIHPKKNVELLIRAWSSVEEEFPNWELVIVGPDKNNDYADKMKDLAIRLSCRRLSFKGELIGEDKLRFMVESDCIVLPTHSENFGMVIAESLACGIPAICSHGAPWSGLSDHKCGWWIEPAEDVFAATMREVMSMTSAELQRMGRNGIAWMTHDFSWNEMGSRMKSAYEWLWGRVEKPDYVVTE